MRRTFLLALLSCLITAAAWAQDIPWNQVVAAGKKGGTLNVYHNVPPPAGDQWLAAFREAFPNIDVEATRLGSGEMQHRFTTESANDVNQGDVLLTLWDDTVAKWVADGWVRVWTPPEAAALPASTNYKNAVYTYTATRTAILYNTAKVRAADAPQEWQDVLDPKWKGAVGMDPPWRSVGVQATLAFWSNIGIKDAAQRLKANDVRFFNGSAGVLQALIRGDIKVAASIEGPSIGAIDDGAPVRIVFPKSGIPAIASVILVPAKAPHPELGMLFLNWALSSVGQQTYQDLAGPPGLRPGLKPPKLVPGNGELKLVWSSDLLTPQSQAAYIDEFRNVFGVK